MQLEKGILWEVQRRAFLQAIRAERRLNCDSRAVTGSA